MRLLCQAGLPGSSAAALARGTISQPNPADAEEARFGQLQLKLVRRVAGGEDGLKADLPPDRKADDQNGSDRASRKGVGRAYTSQVHPPEKPKADIHVYSRTRGRF